MRTASPFARCFLSFLSIVILVAGSGFRARSLQDEEKSASPPSLQGFVWDREGNPIQNARVLAWPTSESLDGPSAETYTDSEGRFHFLLEDFLPLRLRVEAEDFAPWTEKEAIPGVPLGIVLEPGLTLEGFVFDGTNLAPVPGARVEAHPAEGDSPPREAQTGVLETETAENGYFRLDGVGAGLHRVWASAGTLGVASKGSVDPGTPIDLFVFPRSMIVGTVLSLDGEPVEGAMVQITSGPSGSRGPISRQITDAQGRFALTGLAPGKYHLLVQHQGFAPALVSDVVLTSEEDTALKVTLTFGALLSGKLVDTEKRPVQGQVAVERLDGVMVSPLLSDLRSESDEDGQFAIETLPPGTHTLSIQGPGFVSMRIEADIGVRQSAVDLGDIELETGLSIRGWVINPEDTPIGNADIRAALEDNEREARTETPAQATSAPDGSFTLTGLSPASYTLTATAPGYASRQVEHIEAGKDELVLVLSPEGSVTGTVVDEDGHPIETFRVTVLASEPRTGSESSESVISVDGRFALKDLAAGTYVLEVRATDFLPATVSDVKVEPGSDTDVGKIQMAIGGTVVGYVVDSTRMPLPGATVSVFAPGYSFRNRLESVSDADGYFELTGVLHGVVDVVARHPRYADGRVSGLTVDRALGPTEIEIVLSSGGKLEGLVLTRNGAGMPRRLVRFLPLREDGLTYSDSESVETDVSGHFLMERLPSGRGLVQLFHPSNATPEITYSVGSQSEEVLIAENETAWVELISRQVLVHGQVRQKAVPAPGVGLVFVPIEGVGLTVTVARPEGASPNPFGAQHQIARTREDGTYDLLVDQPGAYHVNAKRADGDSFPYRTVNIPDVDAYELDLEFGGTAVFGRVLDEQTESPISRAIVYASVVQRKLGTGPATARTGPEGEFQLELETGAYVLTARAEGYASSTRKLDIGTGGSTEIIFALRPGAVIRGKVMDELRRGIPDLSVRATTGLTNDPATMLAFARTRPDGSFVLEDLAPSQRYNLFTSTSFGKFASQASVPSGADDVVLILRPGGRAVVTVRGREGEPVAGARIDVTAIAAVPVVGGSSGTTNSQGRVELSLPSGPVQIVVTKGELQAAVVLDVPREGTVPAEIMLQPLYQ